MRSPLISRPRQQIKAGKAVTGVVSPADVSLVKGFFQLYIGKRKAWKWDHRMYQEANWPRTSSLIASPHSNKHGTRAIARCLFGSLNHSYLSRPRLERLISGIYQEELYDPVTLLSALETNSGQHNKNVALSDPYRKLTINDSKAANQATSSLLDAVLQLYPGGHHYDHDASNRLYPGGPQFQRHLPTETRASIEEALIKSEVCKGQRKPVIDGAISATLPASRDTTPPTRPINLCRKDTSISHTSWIHIKSLNSLKENVLRSKADETPRMASIHASPTSIAPSHKRQWEIEGSLDGMPVSACPDYGSELDIVSEKFALRHMYSIEGSNCREVRLASGRVSKTLGTLCMPFQFKGESTTHYRFFSILKDAIHDVILGREFLKMTKTLTHFRQRLKESLRPLPQRMRVELTGIQRERIIGSLDGRVVAAVPDTGSDVLLVSRKYAEKSGLVIDRHYHSRTCLEFADGSIAYTSGIVREIPWVYAQSSTSFLCDFHVLDELPYDVVLSNDFLFDSMAFEDHQDAFFEEESSGIQDYSELSLIKEIGFVDKLLDRIRGRGAGAPQQADIITLEAHQLEVRQELQRREQVDEIIAALPIPRQEAAREAERRRREAWSRAHPPLRPPSPTDTRPGV